MDAQPPFDSNRPKYRGRVQKMTTESGEQKGLQQTLEEPDFNVSRLCAKCAPVCPVPNAHRSVRLRRMIAAWRGFSVNKMTSPTKFPCSKVCFRRLAMYFPTQVSLRTQSYLDGESDSSSLINLFYVIYFYSIGDRAKYRYRQVNKNLPTSRRCRLRDPRFMSSRSDTAIHQPFVAVDVSLSHGIDWKCCPMGSTEGTAVFRELR